MLQLPDEIAKRVCASSTLVHLARARAQLRREEQLAPLPPPVGAGRAEALAALTDAIQTILQL